MQSTSAANPFVLMLDPASVLEQIARSERLEHLERRVCRPLDKPLLSGKLDADDEEDASTAFDRTEFGDLDAGEHASPEVEAKAADHALR